MIKNGLYYKKIKNGVIHIGGKAYHIPLKYQYVFIQVDGQDVYLCNIHGQRIVKLVPVKDTMRAAL
ncbi:MAG: hypothetical protein Kow00102_03190 [Spirochaetota bacterium]|nr:hypothetical protein [Spirochaetota bacterium]